MSENKPFLAPIFEKLKPEIETKKITRNAIFHTCSVCGYESAEVHAVSKVLFYRECWVCKLSEPYTEFVCPGECGEKARFSLHNSCSCQKCSYKVSSEELRSHLATGPDADVVPSMHDMLPDALRSRIPPDADVKGISCPACMSRDSVVKHLDNPLIYVCTKCIAISRQIDECRRCNVFQISADTLGYSSFLLEYSPFLGCNFCHDPSDLAPLRIL